MGRSTPRSRVRAWARGDRWAPQSHLRVVYSLKELVGGQAAGRRVIDANGENVSTERSSAESLALAADSLACALLYMAAAEIAKEEGR